MVVSAKGLGVVIGARVGGAHRKVEMVSDGEIGVCGIDDGGLLGARTPEHEGNRQYESRHAWLGHDKGQRVPRRSHGAVGRTPMERIAA